MTTQEVWKGIPMWETSYEVSDRGNVRVVGRGTRWGFRVVAPPQPLQPTHSLGYKRVTLVSKGRERWTIGIHRLVALTFLGVPPVGSDQVNHINSNPSDNRVENLEWCTPKENIHHMISAGHQAVGEALPQSRLTPELVLELRQRYHAGESFTELSKATGVARGAIRKCVTGESWSHVKGSEVTSLRKRVYGRGEACPNSRLKQEVVDEIRRLSSEGQTDLQISRTLGVGRVTVWGITSGRSWQTCS